MTKPSERGLAPPSDLGSLAQLIDRLQIVADDCPECRSLYIVGGPVRDRLLGLPLAAAKDLDFVVEGDALAFGRALEQRWGGQLRCHSAFLTCSWQGADGSAAIDLVTARSESYSRPGALPEVAPSDLAADLKRRDFTINAMAERLWPEPLWERVDPQGGEADLRAGLLRIHHAGSFRDDPTRVFRLARFAVRLSLQPVDATQAALADIVATGFEALTTVGGDRLRAEWGRVCSEPDPFAVVRWLSENKVPQALGFSGDAPALEAVGRMFALRGQGRTVAPSDVLMCWWLAGRMSLSAQESDVALEAFGLQEHRGSWLMQHQAIGRAQQDLAAQVTDDVLEQCLAALDEPTRGALVALHPQTADAVKRYESVVSAIAPLVDGALLLAAGMVEGPAIGQALKKVRIAQLRGQLRSTDDALDFLGLSTP